MTREAQATVDGEEIVIRIRIPKATASEPSSGGDRLIRLEQKACTEAGFELLGLRTKVASGELPSVKIGRASYVRMSDLCALVKARTEAVAPAEPTTPDEDDAKKSYARLATTPRRGRRGRNAA